MNSVSPSHRPTSRSTLKVGIKRTPDLLKVPGHQNTLDTLAEWLDRIGVLSNLPVGKRGDYASLIKLARLVLPTLVPGSPAPPARVLSETIVGNNPLQTQKDLRDPQMTSYKLPKLPAGGISWHNPGQGEYVHRDSKGKLSIRTVKTGIVKTMGGPKPTILSSAPRPTITPGVIAPPPRSAPPIISTKPPGGSMGLDLGAIIGGIGQLAEIYATIQSPQAPAPIMGAVPGYTGGIGGLTTQNVGLTEIFTGEKPRRRRRRRLASMSDISDLAALKSVLGKGEAFNTWIATHAH